MNFAAKNIPVTFSQLLEICNYQQAILDKYEEFIEQNIVNKILEEDFDGDTWNKKPLAMEVCPLEHFYDAEEYHQKYLDKNPAGYCHVPLAKIQWVKTVNPKEYR